MYDSHLIEIAPNCWEMSGRAYLEYHPDRPSRKWDVQYQDDENNTVIKQFDHALDAVTCATA